jgi:hypothetical protein
MLVLFGRPLSIIPGSAPDPLVSTITSSTKCNYYFQYIIIQSIHVVLFIWPSHSPIIRSNILQVFYLILPWAYPVLISYLTKCHITPMLIQHLPLNATTIFGLSPYRALKLYCLFTWQPHFSIIHYYTKTFTRRLENGLGGGWAGCPPLLFGGQALIQQLPPLMLDGGGQRNGTASVIRLPASAKWLTEAVGARQLPRLVYY